MVKSVGHCFAVCKVISHEKPHCLSYKSRPVVGKQAQVLHNLTQALSMSTHVYAPRTAIVYDVAKLCSGIDLT